MAIKFSLKKVRERYIRVVEAPGAVFHVKPMGFDEEVAFDKSFQTFDRQIKQMVTSDIGAHLKAKAVRVILGWTGLPGEDGDIPYSTENLETLCVTAPGMIYAVLRDAGAADAVEVEEAAKN